MEDFDIKPKEKHQFLAGGGEMGALVRGKDWSKNPLGPVKGWPQSLRTTLSILLNSKFPMFLWWGPELICFYNDAYRPSLGENGKHPSILGLPAQDAWPEIWHIIKPLINQVLEGGEATWSEDQLIPIYRNGHIEDVYWTFSYSPVNDETGSVAGVLVTCNETTEQVNIRKKIEESERKLRSVILHAPVAISIFRGTDYILEIANTRALELWGREESDVLHKPILEVMHELSTQGIKGFLDGVYTTGIPFSATERPIRILRKGQLETRYITFVFEAVYSSEGKINGIMAVGSDVTTHVLTRKKIEESEERFRNVANSAPVLIWMSGMDNQCIFFNRAWLSFTGRTMEQEYGNGWLKGVYPDDLQTCLDTFATAFEQHKEFEMEYRLKRHDGVYRWVSANWVPRFTNDGTFEGFTGAAMDINERIIYQNKLKESEEILKESTDRLRLATEGAQMGIWDLNLQTFDIVYSTRLARIFGYDETETNITHRRLREHIHPDDLHTIVEKAFDEALQSGSYYYQARIIHHDESVHWIRISGKVIFDDHAHPVRMLGTVVDITEGQVAEENLRKMAAIVHSSDDAIISKNLDGIITTWNAGAERIFGYTAEEMVGQSLIRLIPADKAGEEPAILAKLRRGERVDHFETKRITKDKKMLDVSLTISPVRDIRGNIIGASKIARDITKQKEIERLIAASEEKFRLLADSMPQFIWTADVEGNMHYFNQSVFDYSGLVPEEMTKGGWMQIVHPDDREASVREWGESVRTGREFISEHRFRRNDGEYRWQLTRAIAQREPEGNIQMWVGTSTDIQQIKELDQQKDYFISMASHELKTPITSMKGYVQILQSMYGNSHDVFLKKSLNIIDKQTGVLTNLIGDLLDLSKIKTGNLLLNKNEFKINALVSEVIAEIKHISPSYSISFSEGEEIEVYADRERIGQVLINFLTNAVKYSPDSREIAIESSRVDDNIVIAVKDSGIGINKQDQEKIFERFYRVEGRNEKTFPGFGIGLFIASEIIHRHNGKIGVKSEPGKGSVFYFSLPLNTHL